MSPRDWTVVRDVVCLEATLTEAGYAIGYRNDDAAGAVALDRLRRGLADLAELWGYSPPQRPVAAVAANDTKAPASAA